MNLPTFLGIGVPRAGTTWLHHFLAAHPDIYMPTKRKEISFFNRYYDRGHEWYGRFFPGPAAGARYRAVGEITPTYIYCPECPHRIREAGIRKLIVILRNPVDRARSHYGFAVRNGGFTGTFDEFTSRHSSAVVRYGYYSRSLSKYFDVFRREDVLVLLYEEAFSDPPRTSLELAEFLRVDAGGFPADSSTRRVNPSYRPRLRTAYGIAHRAARRLRHLDQDWLVNMAKRIGVPRLFGHADVIDSMEDETRRRVALLYGEEIDRLEELLERRLDVWR